MPLLSLKTFMVAHFLSILYFYFYLINIQKKKKRAPLSIFYYFLCTSQKPRTRLCLTLPLLSHFRFRRVLLALVLKCFFFLRFSMYVFDNLWTFILCSSDRRSPLASSLSLLFIFSPWGIYISNKVEFIASLASSPLITTTTNGGESWFIHC